MAKKIIFIINSVIFVALLMVSATNAEVLEDEQNGYRIHYPFGWQVTRFPNSADLVKANINRDSSTGLQVRIYPTNGRDFNSFVDWYVKDFMLQMKGGPRGNISLIDKNFTYIGVNEGCMISFDSLKEDGSRWFMKEYLIPAGDKVYVLVSGTIFSSREQNEPLLDSIAQSLEFK
ncbi:MAG: hypothetical protein V1923_05105 [Candidatus Omnitrophota bacterium]